MHQASNQQHEWFELPVEMHKPISSRETGFKNETRNTDNSLLPRIAITTPRPSYSGLALMNWELPVS